jgi:hypothetical protein
MDYEFWGELFLSGAKFRYTGIPFGIFREHGAQKSSRTLLQTRSMVNAARQLADRADSLSLQTKREIISDLEDYFVWYEKAVWKATGRLARLGLPRWFVTVARATRSLLSGGTRRACQARPGSSWNSRR